MKKQTSRESKAAIAPWQALYQAALFETDQQMIPGKIAEAEKAILCRVKELFQAESDHVEEDMVLDDALYALRALRNCIVVDPKAA